MIPTPEMSDTHFVISALIFAGLAVLVLLAPQKWLPWLYLIVVAFVGAFVIVRILYA